MTNDRLYFSIAVRNSPFSRDAEIFMDALQMMDCENPVKQYSASSVLPYHGTAGNSGIMYMEISNNLTPEQKAYFNQFAYVYEDKKAFEAAKRESFDFYYAHSPDPG
jgi:hypothetical protein